VETIAILGSRNPEGQTARATKALLAGLGCENPDECMIFLPSMEIEVCRQCDAQGWGLCRSENRCVIQDDFEEIVGKIRDADVVVFATPVYFADLSESLRAFLDRFRRAHRPKDGDEAGLGEKTTVGICVAGGGGGGAPNCAASLEKILAISGLDVFDMVPARRQNLDLKVDVLRRTGEYIAQQQA